MPQSRMPQTLVPSRVLLAEDNAINQLMIIKTLEKKGHTVVAAVDDGREAVRFLEALVLQPGALGVDLVLLNGMMTNLDGIGATRAVRAMDGVVGRLPIVVLTADAVTESLGRYMGAGPDPVLTKPVDFGKLIGTIEGLVLERRAAERERGTVTLVGERSAG